MIPPDAPIVPGNAAWAKIMGIPIPSAVEQQMAASDLAMFAKAESIARHCRRIGPREFIGLLFCRIISRKWRRATRSPLALFSLKHVYTKPIAGVDTVACVKCGHIKNVP